MKKLIFLMWILAVAGVFNLNAQVAKPQFKSSKLPAVWSSVAPAVRLKALRVAQLDAYRALVERVYGFQLASGSTVYDYMLASDRVRNAVDQILKGQAETEQPVYDENGMVSVVYGIKLRKIVETITTEETFDKVTVSKIISSSDNIVEAAGYGALPDSLALRMLRAKRAAELDAFRLMAERFVGVRISSRTSVADLCLRNDTIRAATVAFLKGLKPVSITYDETGACTVKMQLKIKETVETVESLVKIYNSGAKEKITNVDISSNDKTFTVEGHGAPDGDFNAGQSGDIYRAEKVVFQRVISSAVVVD